MYAAVGVKSVVPPLTAILGNERKYERRGISEAGCPESLFESTF
jgi:hypothetical protein